MQRNATHCNTLQDTTTQNGHTTEELEPIATHCNTLQHNATHCNSLQHAATRCNTTEDLLFVDPRQMWLSLDEQISFGDKKKKQKSGRLASSKARA